MSETINKRISWYTKFNFIFFHPFWFLSISGMVNWFSGVAPVLVANFNINSHYDAMIWICSFTYRFLSKSQHGKQCIVHTIISFLEVGEPEQSMCDCCPLDVEMVFSGYFEKMSTHKSNANRYTFRTIRNCSNTTESVSLFQMVVQKIKSWGIAMPLSFYDNNNNNTFITA